MVSRFVAQRQIQNRWSELLKLLDFDGEGPVGGNSQCSPLQNWLGMTIDPETRSAFRKPATSIYSRILVIWVKGFISKITK